MQDQWDIVIVGAGAAGLGAAQALQGCGLSALVVEARDRIGGRGHTIDAAGLPLDLGCGWLHSADENPMARLADTLGFPLDKTPPPWMRQSGNVELSPPEQSAFGRALAALEARVEEAARRGEDRPVGDLMEPGEPFNALLDAFSSWYNGVEFGQVSTLDYSAYRDTDVNWRTPRGYGALVAAAGAQSPILLDTPVTAIDHGGPRLRLETARGPLSARAVIVTVPTALIAEGGLVFRPALPDLFDAAANLPLGLADKVFLRLDEPEAFERDGHLFGDPSRTETGSYHLRPFGRPVIEAYLGGRHAHALEREGHEAAGRFAVEELAALLGSGVRDTVHPIAASAWGRDPWSRGAYSYALPGHADARRAFAQPIQDRIFIAGEAASAASFSTVHGAYLSGRDAAVRCRAALSG